MNIIVIRKILSDTTSIGELYINNVFECFTLEDKDRGLRDDMTSGEISELKVKNDTAIPYGSYSITVDYTGLRGVGERTINGVKVLPRVNSVKGFSGIRIHVGNYASSTEGCLLVGQLKSTNAIGGSKPAFVDLFDKIIAALGNNETVNITFEQASTYNGLVDTRTEATPLVISGGALTPAERLTLKNKGTTINEEYTFTSNNTSTTIGSKYVKRLAG